MTEFTNELNAWKTRSGKISFLYRALSDYNGDSIDLGFFSDEKALELAKKEYMSFCSKYGDSHENKNHQSGILDKYFRELSFKVEWIPKSGDKIYVVFSGFNDMSPEKIFRNKEKAFEYTKKKIKEEPERANGMWQDGYDCREYIIGQVHHVGNKLDVPIFDFFLKND